MTDDEFEDLGRGPGADAATAKQAQQRLDDRIKAWQFSTQCEEEAVTSLKAARKNSHAATHQLLACMYALAPQLQVGGTLDTQLRQAIDDFPEQSERKREWRPKDGYDVALTYVLGLTREVASTKSNWRKTLAQAEKEKIDFTEEAFLGWIKKLGGEEKARRPEKRKPVNAEFVGSSLSTAPDPDNAFQVPLPAEQNLPGGLAVVLAKVYKRDGDRCLLEPVEVFTDVGTVEATAAKLKRKWDSTNRAEVRKLQREQERERKRQQKLNEHGYRPPKKQAKRRKTTGPQLGFRRRKAKGSTIADFLKESVRPPQRRPSN